MVLLCRVSPYCLECLLALEADFIDTTSSDGTSWSFEPEMVLTKADQEELLPSNYWLLPSFTNGHIDFDFGCLKKLNTIELVNTHHASRNNRGTKEFEVSTRNSSDVDWTTILGKTELEDPRNMADPLPLKRFHFKAIETRFMRLKIVSFYEKGGGLQYLNYSLKGIYGFPINLSCKILYSFRMPIK